MMQAGRSKPRCSEAVQSIVDAFIQDSSDTHALTDARIRQMKPARA